MPLIFKRIQEVLLDYIRIIYVSDTQIVVRSYQKAKVELQQVSSRINYMDIHYASQKHRTPYKSL